MRPAGATLRLFAQWLRPTTICILRETLSHFLRTPWRPCLCGVSPFLGVVFVLKKYREKQFFGLFLLSILQNLWT